MGKFEPLPFVTVTFERFDTNSPPSTRISPSCRKLMLILIEAVTRGLDAENDARVLANFRQNVRSNFVLFREGKA